MDTETLAEINRLTQQFVECTDYVRFTQLMDTHESLVGKLVGLQPVKSKLFSDFDGHVKSLGGWGGDLVLVASEADPTAYFRQKGYDTLLPFRQLIA